MDKKTQQQTDSHRTFAEQRSEKKLYNPQAQEQKKINKTFPLDRCMRKKYVIREIKTPAKSRHYGA